MVGAQVGQIWQLTFHNILLREIFPQEDFFAEKGLNL